MFRHFRDEILQIAAAIEPQRLDKKTCWALKNAEPPDIWLSCN